MNFQLASDLHIESHGGLRAAASCFPVRKAPILALCGDLFPYSLPGFSDVLKRVAEPFDMVLYVPGNHELYGSTEKVEVVQRKIEDACFAAGKVVYMSERSIAIQGIQFIGATLWTNAPTDERADLMNDYDVIYKFTAKDGRALHDRHRDFIETAIKQAKKDGQKGAVVLSHHAPDDRLAYDVESRPEELFPFYFASDLHHITTDPFIKVWCHGHTHEAYRTKLDANGPVFASNAFGYPGEQTGYSQSAVIRIWNT